MALHYTNEITINLPRKEVAEIMENPENLPLWQPGFQSIKHVSGERGSNGMISELHYKMGKRDIHMTETITNYGFPESFDATYITDGVYNEQKNQLIEIDANTTKWVSESYFKFTNFMMKVIGFLMPKSFEKQTCEYMENFKKLCESQRSA
ncbi:MAG: hypothetical protein Salg2KO_21320 [Salibacteraceae bacterium]